MKVSELVTRARSALGKGIKYRMGSGGMDPSGTTPAGLDGALDCSGFSAWALGFSRQSKDPFYLKVAGSWVNTDAMVLDAKDPRGFLARIPQPKVGCLILYGKGWGGHKVGHVGIVTKVSDPDPEGTRLPLRVVHCNSKSYRETGDAIAETGPEVFLKAGAIYVWPDFLVEG